MLTFQILDGGETFYSPLEGRALTIGSGPGADIRLTEGGVAPEHARVEPVTVEGRRRAYKLVDLDSETGTRVNGEQVAQVLLRLGDRVEIGGAVLLLGKRVARRATPADVLDDALDDDRPAARPRRRRAAPRRAAARPWVGALVLAVLVVAGGLWWLGGDDHEPVALTEQAELRQAGRFAEARRMLETVRTDWAGSRPERVALTDQALARLEGTVEATAELRARLASEAPTRTFAEQVTELKELAQHDEPALAEAARILHRELMELRTTALEDHRRRLLAEQTSAPARTAAASQPAAARPEATVGEAAGAPELAAVLDSVDRLTAEGQYAQALETLREAMATTPAELAEPLRDRMAEQRARTRTEMAALVAEARRLAAAGQLDQAIGFLRGHVARFPSSGTLGGLAREIDSLEAEATARAATVAQEAALARRAVEAETVDPRAVERRRLSTSAVADVLARVREAERRGDYAAAATLLQDAAARVAEQDPPFAQRLGGQAEDMRYLVALTEMVVARLRDGRSAEVPLRRGEVGVLVGVRGHALEVETAAGSRQLGWPDLPPDAVRALVAELSGGPPALLGAAVLAYRNGDQETAEACLAHALKDDESLQHAVWGVLRRGRAEPPDPSGYTLVAGKFVGLQRIAAEKLARQLERKVAAALRGGAAQRDKLVDELLAQGPQAIDGLLLALEQTQAELAGKLENHPFKKRVYDRLAAQREKLDAAREHAKALIYDEVKYFYPYKPPAVDPDKAAEYWPVQKEVDVRVAAVRELWEDRTVRGRIPPALLEDARRFQWVTAMLADFAERRPDVEQRVAWVLTLPPDGQLDLQSFCKTPRERADLDLYARIDAFNDAQLAVVKAAERRQVEITNAYRRMFGHRVLAVNLKIHKAALGHSEEMSTLGYFGHFSPTPGRRTPFDRMRLAGYAMGASENCAINGSAEGAHVAWLHSSGHHRNLLLATHKEFGVGNSGSYWTQNFGAGDEFLEHQDFPAVR